MNKEFKVWLILNYKTGQFKVTKKKPFKLNASDIPIDIKLNVEIPEHPIMKAEGTIKLSQAKINEMVIEEL